MKEEFEKVELFIKENIDLMKKISPADFNNELFKIASNTKKTTIKSWKQKILRNLQESRKGEQLEITEQLNSEEIKKIRKIISAMEDSLIYIEEEKEKIKAKEAKNLLEKLNIKLDNNSKNHTFNITTEVMEEFKKTVEKSKLTQKEALHIAFKLFINKLS